MKFTYGKDQSKFVEVGHEPKVLHWFELEGSKEHGGFRIYASDQGVWMHGQTQLFQPVEEEMRIPENFREFLVRLNSAFDLCFKEQEKERRNAAARKSFLEA